MKKKIQFSLVYRDMWQSSGKFQPRKDQLERVAPAIIDMGCFSRVETNGGAFEQVNLLAGENPNEAVRAFCKPFNEVGIKTHMLDRGLNALRMYPVPDDVRRLMYKVKHAQGVDIPRIFCGLNDVRNIIPSIKWALEAGMTPQATLCITTSPIHTVEYYSNIADQVIAAGATEICLKDMAGIGQPAMLGKLTKAIKDKHPDVIIQYHGHSGPGLSMASILEVCNNGADVIDTAIEPLSWGKVHPDIISVQSMLKNEGFEVADIDMNAYMRARTLTQEFIDDWLGYFINPGNKHMSSLLLGCGLPGGMMGSMMADLARNTPFNQLYTEEQGTAGTHNRRDAGETVRRSGICMAARRLSTTRNSVLTICQEHRTAQPAHHGTGQGPLRNDGRLYVGNDSRQERKDTWNNRPGARRAG